MSSHSNNDCGGWNIRIRLHTKGASSPDCYTEYAPELNAGDELTFDDPMSNPNVTSPEDCPRDFTVSGTDTLVFIESTDGNDFCPKVVRIYTTDATYATDVVDRWYDYDTNGRTHSIH